MLTTTFDYKRAKSVDEVLQLLSETEDAKILAGGHSLIPAMKLRLNSPDTLIDIAKIKDLQYIRDSGDHIVIGSGTTHNEIATSSLVQSAIPMIAQAAGMIGDIQVRNRGTLGGSLAHADPAADWPGLMLAAEAKIELKNSSSSRTVAAGDFFTGFYETALEDNEIITAIHLPKPPANSSSAYLKFVQPASRFAIVGCAIQLTMEGDKISRARVAYNGLSDKAFRDNTTEKNLEGRSLEDSAIDEVAKDAGQTDYVLSDHFASEEYRQHLAKVYLKRVLHSIKSENTKDDLTKIEGIGPKIAEILNKGGINSYKQLSNASIADIKAMLTAEGNRYAIHDPGTWGRQAQMAADGKWEELKKWQDELDGGR